MVTYNFRKICRCDEPHYFYGSQEVIDETVNCNDHPDSPTEDYVIESILNG